MSRCDTSHSLFANSDICNSVWLCTHRKRRGSYFNKGRSLVATVTVKRTEHAARQAGRQDIDSPHLNSGQPLTKLTFPHDANSSFPSRSCSRFLFFLLHPFAPPLPPSYMRVEVRAKPGPTRVCYYGYGSSR